MKGLFPNEEEEEEVDDDALFREPGESEVKADGASGEAALPEGDDKDEPGEGGSVDGGDVVTDNKLLSHPGAPTAHEVAEQEAGGHAHCRTWCRSCV